MKIIIRNVFGDELTEIGIVENTDMLSIAKILKEEIERQFIPQIYSFEHVPEEYQESLILQSVDHNKLLLINKYNDNFFMENGSEITITDLNSHNVVKLENKNSIDIFHKIFDYLRKPYSYNQAHRRFNSRFEYLDKPTSKCQSCKRAEAQELHSCPYQCDMYSNYKENCNCCSSCIDNCLGDI